MSNSKKITWTNLGAVYAGYTTEIMRYVRTYFRDDSFMHDIAQDVFLLASESIESTTVTEESARNWLFKITRNHCLKLKRRLEAEHRAYAKYQNEVAHAHVEDTTDKLAIEELLAFADQHFNRRENLLFQYRFMQRWKLQQIAEKLNISLTNVHRISHRVLEKLKAGFAA